MLNMYTSTLGGNALYQARPRLFPVYARIARKEEKLLYGCLNIGLQVHVLQWLDIIVRDDNTMPLTTAC